MRTIRLLLIIFSLFIAQQSYAQIVAPTGTISKASSQLIYFYDQSTVETDLLDTTSYIQVTNTAPTQGVWVHVQVFRSFNVSESPLVNEICDERNFVDFLTPRDTHVYNLGEPNFPKNTGEDESNPGERTSIDVTGTKGFIVITPVVSEADLTAISFQHMMGGTKDDFFNFRLNAMGRDAVDFTTGGIPPDGTPLDGTTNGYVSLQPEELLFSVPRTGEGLAADFIGIAFSDSYGGPGLLGYQVVPGEVDWTTFLFDFKEDPTSCGDRTVSCFFNVGLNEDLVQSNFLLNPVVDDLLCSGSSVPDHETLGGFGWGRIFVSGVDEFENHLGLSYMADVPGAEWMFVRGERTEIMPPAEDEICDDGIDNDGDGFEDCLDTDCATDEACETGEEECSDGIDNDGDEQTDCADLGCDGFAGCEFGTEVSCDDGIDNDADGDTDGADSDCQEADTGDGDGGDGGGCTVASSVTTATAAANFLLPLLPLAGVYGIRRLRRRNRK